MCVCVCVCVCVCGISISLSAVGNHKKVKETNASKHKSFMNSQDLKHYTKRGTEWWKDRDKEGTLNDTFGTYHMKNLFWSPLFLPHPYQMPAAAIFLYISQFLHPDKLKLVILT